MTENNDICLYEKISTDIKELILSGKIKYREKVPSVSDIRGKYNVSHITALRVFRKLVEENYIDYIKGKGYFASLRNENSSQKLKNALGCLIRPLWKYNLTDNYYNEIFCGLQREAQRRRLDLIQPYPVYCLDLMTPDPEGIKDIRDAAFKIADNIDGFIIDDRIPDSIVEDIMNETSKPVIIIDRSSKLNVDTVTADNEGGASQAAVMALDKGYEEFIICRGGGTLLTYNQASRANAFEDTLNKHGAVTIHMVEKCDIDPWKTTIDRILNLLENKKSFRTLIYASPGLARHICDTLHGKGFKIGKEVGIVCFEATGFAKLRKPHITSVNINTYEMGEMAIEILCGRINLTNPAAKTNHKSQVMFSIGDTL